MPDVFGPVPCVFLSGTFMAIVWRFALHLLTFYAIIPFYGSAQMIYNIADLAMATRALPDEENRGRDMGCWSAVQLIGQALGSVFGGTV